MNEMRRIKKKLCEGSKKKNEIEQEKKKEEKNRYSQDNSSFCHSGIIISYLHE